MNSIFRFSEFGVDVDLFSIVSSSLIRSTSVLRQSLSVRHTGTRKGSKRGKRAGKMRGRQTEEGRQRKITEEIKNPEACVLVKEKRGKKRQRVDQIEDDDGGCVR